MASLPHSPHRRATRFFAGSASGLLLMVLTSCEPPTTDRDGSDRREAPPALENPSELDPRVVQRIEQARAAVLQRPGEAQVWAELGMVFENERMRGRAAECYREAAGLEPREPRYWFHSAGALNKIGRNKEAIEAIKRSLELDDAYAPSHARLGSFLFEDGYLDEALVAFQQAIQVDKSYPGGWVGVARVKLQIDEIDAAIEILEQQLGRRPDDVLIKRVLAGAYRQAGRGNELEIPADNGRESSRWPDPWAEELRRHQDDPAMRRVTKLLLDGNKQEALAVLEGMRERAESPDDELVYLLQLAGLYADLGRNKEAEGSYRRLLELQPENSQVYSRLAEIYENVGQLPSAVGAIRTAIQMNPNHPPTYRLAGRIYYKATLFSDAAEAFEKVLAYGENSTGIQYLLGMSRLGEKSWKEAEACFSRVLEAEPDHAEAWFAMARVWLKLKRLDEAEKALLTAEQKGFANDAMVSQVRASLERARARASRRKDKDNR